MDRIVTFAYPRERVAGTAPCLNIFRAHAGTAIGGMRIGLMMRWYVAHTQPGSEAKSRLGTCANQNFAVYSAALSSSAGAMRARLDWGRSNRSFSAAL